MQRCTLPKVTEGLIGLTVGLLCSCNARKNAIPLPASNKNILNTLVASAVAKRYRRKCSSDDDSADDDDDDILGTAV